MMATALSIAFPPLLSISIPAFADGNGPAATIQPLPAACQVNSWSLIEECAENIPGI